MVCYRKQRGWPGGLGHLFRPHSKFLRARDCTLSRRASRTRHRDRGRRRRRCAGICQVSHCSVFHRPSIDLVRYSSPVGVYPKAENCVFAPIPCELKFHESERSGRELYLSPVYHSFMSSQSTFLPLLHPQMISSLPRLSLLYTLPS